jgi:TDG/mug DNA glycosylase family protein
MSLGCPLLGPDADRLHGLPPVVDARARVLVLGSMPGAESLRRQEYYAHPRNHFWRIVEDVLGVPRALPYPRRLEGLRDAGVALWDVLGECARHGSLDTGIERDSMAVNDIPALLAQYPRIDGVLFNGLFAETVFRSRLGAAVGPALPRRRLPSTSPANAARPYAEKLSAWREALQPR